MNPVFAEPNPTDLQILTEDYGGTSAKKFIASLQNATAGKSTKMP